MELSGKKILIVRLSALGDVIFNIPLANALKRAGAEVHWVVCEKGFDIIKSNPCVDKAIFAPLEKWKKEKNLFKNWVEFWQIEKAIRAEKYDIVLDTQMLFKSMFWTMFSNAKRKIMAKNARELSFLAANEFIEPVLGDFQNNVVDEYLKYAKYLGIDDLKIEKTLPELDTEASKKIDELLKTFDKAKPILIIAPATTWDNKHWDKDNWRNLLDKIDTNAFNIAFIGVKKDDELISYINQNRFLNLAGKTNLKELLEIFKRADYVISLDSGSTHLAWLCNSAKILSIFCSTPASRYAPRGDKYVPIQAQLPCQPCHRRKCPLKTNACTKVPTADEVFKYFKNLIK